MGKSINMLLRHDPNLSGQLLQPVDTVAQVFTGLKRQIDATDISFFMQLDVQDLSLLH